MDQSYQFMISRSVNQSISVDAVPNRMDGESSTGRHVPRSTSRVWDGLGGRCSHWGFSPSAQLGDAQAPCAALQGLKYRYAADWHDPLERTGI